MTLHSIKEYLRYRWVAQGRHGVHSPFVYSFIEEVLQGRKRTLPRKDTGGVPHQYLKLIYKIMKYFGTEEVFYYATFEGASRLYQFNPKRGFVFKEYRDELPEHIEMLWIEHPDVAKWTEAAIGNLNRLIPSGMVILSNIHKTEEASKTWEAMHSRSEVTLSLDIYRIGLLFFKNEFKEKQHFVLKY